MVERHGSLDTFAPDFEGDVAAARARLLGGAASPYELNTAEYPAPVLTAAPQPVLIAPSSPSAPRVGSGLEVSPVFPDDAGAPVELGGAALVPRVVESRADAALDAQLRARADAEGVAFALGAFLRRWWWLLLLALALLVASRWGRK